MMKGIIVKEKTSLPILLIIAVICIVAGNPAQATPITFSFTGVGSGNLETTVFTDAAFEVLISADTDDMYISPQGNPCIDAPSGTIDISGVGIGTFVEPLYVFDNQTTNAVGFGNRTEYDLIDLCVIGVGLDTYDLTTPFGPITDLDPFFGQFVNVELSIGALTFTSMSSATFTAIPEPGTVLLVAIGGLVIRRRKV
jgi:hypothetical protein